jgi:antitoxin (DNA-binding transcriptional repressor) of toxin-antitoxin stability system
MKTATVRELRNDFGRLSAAIEKGQSVQILKRGRPFARLVPEPRKKHFFASGAGAVKLPPDIDEPLGIAWEAAR